MTIERIKNWPFPEKGLFKDDPWAYLELLYAALHEESVARVEDSTREVLVGANLFELDSSSDLQPKTSVEVDAYFELDGSDNIMPKVA